MFKSKLKDEMIIFNNAEPPYKEIDDKIEL